MRDDDPTSARLRWARLRLQIIGPLLAAPAEHGELAARIAALAQTAWQNPTTGLTERFSAKTIERWFYLAKDQADPLAVLARKVPSHAGTHPGMPARLAAVLEAQYRAHPRWTMQLHHDNLLALCREDASLGPPPSYTTTRRFMNDRGWLRDRTKRARKRPGELERAHEPRETRSFEVTHVHAMWHLDFHELSRKLLLPSGEWARAVVLCILDDRSRLVCHAQVYLDETAETLIHGLSQAIAKRGLPRALLTDNGAAMLADETREGLERLGILHHTTLPYSPEQNAKQEVIWAQVEGRFVAMLDGQPELSLPLVNEALQAWVELEYQRKRHDELGDSPLATALAGPTVVRPSPPWEALRRAFRTERVRVVRRSDGTFTVGGVRFELPSAYRTLTRVHVRVARWDLSSVDLVDPRHDTHLVTVLPLDKAKNADGRRRTLAPVSDAAATTPVAPPSGIAPLLKALMAEYAATGLPPAYLPKDHISAPPGALEDDRDDHGPYAQEEDSE
jgi:transposase InsO family protein